MSATIARILEDHPEWGYLLHPQGKPPAHPEPPTADEGQEHAETVEDAAPEPEPEPATPEPLPQRTPRRIPEAEPEGEA